jgi:hypothetical protein
MNKKDRLRIELDVYKVHISQYIDTKNAITKSTDSLCNSQNYHFVSFKTNIHIYKSTS